MANFLRSIGVTDTLGRSTEGIVNTAMGLRNQQDREALQAQQQQMNDLDIARQRIGLKAEQDAATQRNTPRPMSAFIGHMTPGQQEFLTKMASDAGLVTMVGNVPMMTQAQAESGLHLLGQNQEWQKNLIGIGANETMQELQALESKDPSKMKPEDKQKIQQLHQALSAHGIAQKELEAGPQLKEVPQGGTLYDVGQGSAVAQGSQPTKTDFETFAAGERDRLAQSGVTNTGEVNRQVSKAWDQKKANEKIQEKLSEAKAKNQVDETSMKPVVDQIIAQNSYDPATLGIFGGDRKIVSSLLAKDYPNVDPNKLHANAKFIQDPVMNRTVVWANAAEPRVQALKEQIKTLKPGQFPDANALKNWLAYHLGDDNIAGMIAGTNSTLFEALRSVGGSGQFSDFRLKLEQSQMNPNMNQKQFEAAANNILAAIQSVKRARLTVPYDDTRIDPSKGPSEKPGGKKYPALNSALNDSGQQQSNLPDPLGIR